MSKAMVRTMVVGCILLSTLLWAADSGLNRPQGPVQLLQPQETKDPYLNSRVLVEAFMVKVELPVLYEMGVSPLGERPHSVTVQHILQYLKARKNTGILAGAKLAMRHGERSTTRGTRNVYLERKAGDSSVMFTPYDSGETFNATVRVVSEGVISVEYLFELSTFVQSSTQEDQAPPQKASWSWSGDVSLEAGRPVIAGATQEEDSVVFLVLVAHFES